MIPATWIHYAKVRNESINITHSTNIIILVYIIYLPMKFKYKLLSLSFLYFFYLLRFDPLEKKYSCYLLVHDPQTTISNNFVTIFSNSEALASEFLENVSSVIHVHSLTCLNLQSDNCVTVVKKLSWYLLFYFDLLSFPLYFSKCLVFCGIIRIIQTFFSVGNLGKLVKWKRKVENDIWYSLETGNIHYFVMIFGIYRKSWIHISLSMLLWWVTFYYMVEDLNML